MREAAAKVEREERLRRFGLIVKKKMAEAKRGRLIGEQQQLIFERYAERKAEEEREEERQRENQMVWNEGSQARVREWMEREAILKAERVRILSEAGVQEWDEGEYWRAVDREVNEASWVWTPGDAGEGGAV